MNTPGAETKAIGLQADALFSWFLQAPLRQLYSDWTTPTRLPGFRHLDIFAWTRNLSPVNRDFAKTHANPDADGNSIKPPGR